MRNFKEIINRLWNSPTFTTWGSFIAKPLNIVLLMPLILSIFPTEDTAVWFLFLLFIGLQNIADFGFGITFVRAIAYAVGGAKEIVIFSNKAPRKTSQEPNNQLIAEIQHSMRWLYLGLALFTLLVLGSAGTWAVLKPLSESNYSGLHGELAWAIIVLATSLRIYANSYKSYLLGLNEVALIKRWETLINSLQILSSYAVVWFTKDLLLLVVVHQFWAVVLVVTFSQLSRYKKLNFKIKFSFETFKRIFLSIFPSAWRSWVGVLMSYGVLQLSGIIIAQMGNAAQTSAYLLSLKIADVLAQFSGAPFYSKLPLLARLKAEGKHEQLLKIAKKGMLFTLSVFAVGYISVLFAADFFLNLLGSNTVFVSQNVWIALGLAYFVERYGAMHIQLYSTTNHIIWHKANGISGSIYLILSYLLIDMGVIAFPLSYLTAYLLFYAWYAAWHSYREFGMKFLSFELKTSFFPLMSILLADVLAVFWFS